MGRSRIIIQDKDISGNLGSTTVKNAIAGFKEAYIGLKDNDRTPISGFELNGGNGMTEKAQEAWNAFENWSRNKGLKTNYNNNQEIETIRNLLREQLGNKNKNRR